MSRRSLAGRLFGLGRWTATAVAVGLLLFLGLRVWESQRGPPLEVWHIFVPEELAPGELETADWAGYLVAEERIFGSLRTEVTQRLPLEERIPVNRYFEGSPIYPGHFAEDWNRSQVLIPVGPPKGAAVLLHGLTDAPYSQRHIAALYRDHGFVAIVPRLPAHGTVPAALTDIEWPSWAAATRLAVREARRLVGPGLPLHLVGFSNGGALALQYALDAIEDPALAQPDRLVLVSPMVGITAFARFAGIAGWPALFPAFAKAAWLSVVPEFIPFKYNSFPVNGARQSFLLTQALQAQLNRLARSGRLGELAPVLTFQSVVDFTVSTRAIVASLYGQLPANGSELVLFDLNRTIKFGPLLSASADTVLARIVPPPPRRYALAIVANAASEAGTASDAMVERLTPAGSTEETVKPLSLVYPPTVFSLSHLALPFPVSDALYGMAPDEPLDFGISLGTLATRGERGALIVSLDSLLRMTSNPFYPYLAGRIAAPLPPAGGSG